MKSALVCWGSSGVFGRSAAGDRTDYYRAWCLIREGGKAFGYSANLVQYPGHPGEEAAACGQLSYQSALASAKAACDALHPEWLIGRSLGALVVAGLVAEGRDSLRGLRGAVLWGPGIRKYMDIAWPNPSSKSKAVTDYATFGTVLESDYFDTLPDIERMIPLARANLRLARGDQDKYNTRVDFEKLAEIHSRSQPSFQRQVVTLRGLDHTPTRERCPEQDVERYLECLFGCCF
jgi:pimeloyl-ACP methyl ester carboxylesterase